MLWLRFPGHVDIPRFVKQAGVQLKSFEELEQEDTSTSILVHVVYSTDQAPRAVIHDPTDSVFVPVNVSGLSVSVPYLLPRVLVVERPKSKEEKEEAWPILKTTPKGACDDGR